jgi:hypothetical protein
LNFDNFTLYIDSSVITRYGEREGSAKGYNKHNPGRKLQHPLLAFVAEVKMVANFWLHSGDAYTSNNFFAFLEETLSFFNDKRIGLLRLNFRALSHAKSAGDAARYNRMVKKVLQVDQDVYTFSQKDAHFFPKSVHVLPKTYIRFFLTLNS